MNYRKVDILKYVSEGVINGSLVFKRARKFQRIIARQGKVGEEVSTVLADGTIEVEKNNEGIYKPKGSAMLAAQISEDLEITPPNWGGAIQKINSGGYLLMNPQNPKDIYGIGEEEFNNTYVLVDENKKTL